MDVLCQRCATEYELDDARVSERGTKVQCSSCGEEFRVYRGYDDQLSPILRDDPSEPPITLEPSSIDLTPGLVDVDSDPYPHDWRPPRARPLRLALALILVGATAVVLFGAGRPHLERVLSKLSRDTAETDVRLDDVLQAGEAALVKGDLESARAIFASMRGSRHPALLASLARLAAVEADLAWLKLRLLPEGSEARASAARRFQDTLAEAEEAVTQLAEEAPEAPSTYRAKLDVQRIGGDLAGARALVPRTVAIASQPETTYVLAMLDFAEPSPSFRAVAERLRLALASEEERLRARPMLVYAFTRSGDPSAAKIELAKLLASHPPHPLASELRAFLADAESPQR